jgi:hypothetical protein
MTRVGLITIPLFREITEEKICDKICSFQKEKKSNRVENTGVLKRHHVVCSEMFSEVQRPSWKLESAFPIFSVK